MKYEQTKLKEVRESCGEAAKGKIEEEREKRKAHMLLGLFHTRLVQKA